VNIPGVSNYSKETVGLRQPSRILDQQFRLVYVYPMLFSDVMKNRDLQDDLRSFLAISFLREIFISNSLNIIQMASQIRTDINAVQPSTVSDSIGNAVLSSTTNNRDRYPTYQDTSLGYQLQNRVEAKTSQIVKYLASDARTKKLRPQIEIVTLNNLIDVPVIVGTKDYTVPTYPLIYILLIAVATQTPLDRYSNIEKIVRVLKNANEKDWSKLLSKYADTEEKINKLAKWANDHPNFKGKLQLNRTTRWLATKLGINKEESTPTETRDLAPSKEYDRLETENLFNILKLVKSSLDDISLMFKFVLSPDLLKSQVGLNISNNTMEQTITKLSSNQRQIFMSMHDKFMELMSVPGSLFLSSVFNTLYPSPSQTAPNTYVVSRPNFLEIKEKHIDNGLSAKIQKLIFDTFAEEIKNSFGQYTPNESTEKVNLLKALCNSMNQIDGIFNDTLKKFVDTPDNSIRSVNFTPDNLNRFTSEIHNFASELLSQNKRLENGFSQLVTNGKALLRLAQTQIYSSIEDFMGDIYKPSGTYYTSAMEYLYGVDNEEVQKTYIPQMCDTLFTIFYFFFLYRLQAAICSYVDVIDVELESKVNDVIDFPNYTLVITADVLKAVYTAHMASNLNTLMTKSIHLVGRITENNIKGMIKFLCTRMKIPSIIVHDELTNTIYYQFMFMSTTEKISGTSLDSFIKANKTINY